MAKITSNSAALAKTVRLHLSPAATPDGLRPLLPDYGRNLLRCTTCADQTTSAGQTGVLTAGYDCRSDHTASQPSGAGSSGQAAGVVSVGQTDSSDHFVVASGTFCRTEPQLCTQQVRRNSRPGQRTTAVALVSIAAVLQRRQHHAEPNSRVVFTPVLTEMHYG